METAFEKLIKDLPRNLSVMDVGYGGLGGENTTNYLRKHFGTIFGLCKDAIAVKRYKEMTDANDTVILGIYPQHMLGPRKYDLLVLDPRIDDNLEFWSEDGMELAWTFVKEGGYIITYIMAPNKEYGEDEVQTLITEHRDRWWTSYRKIPVVAAEVEERRPYITWVLMKKP
jgi:hypothetical protein